MNEIRIMMVSKRKLKKNLLITFVTLSGIYLIISFYFFTHFSFHTEINGNNVSLQSHKKSLELIQEYLEDYKLQLMERNNETELISGKEINMTYNPNFNLLKFRSMQNPFLWIITVFQGSSYHFTNLYTYDTSLLERKINALHCLNKNIKEPKNAGFRYTNGTYSVVKEQYGDQIHLNRLTKTIHLFLTKGKTNLDLNQFNCYVNPIFTTKSKKTTQVRKLLNQYVSSKITYHFGDTYELLDANKIHLWLSIDDNLEIKINKEAIKNYIVTLSKKYDTVGIPREFHTSTGKTIEVKGGLYGWKIDRQLEAHALFNHILRGEVLGKEPAYLQKALSREGNEIGDTYIEINITKQHVWFYKDGKLLVQSSVVTGNPSRGNATVLGVYMINYKQLNATLVGENYASKVKYWMPFFGNMGLHDASWRSSFGGTIYKTRGSHGCVNAPIYLAKIVFENIESGTPVIVYEE